MKLIHPALLIVGYVMVALTVISALLCIGFVIYYREKSVLGKLQLLVSRQAIGLTLVSSLCYTLLSVSSADFTTSFPHHLMHWLHGVGGLHYSDGSTNRISLREGPSFDRRAHRCGKFGC